MTTKRKTIRSALKANDKGYAEVVFATLDVVDHDGDILTKEAFTDGAPIVISAYGHGSHRGELPLGRGKIAMTDDEAIAKLQFFMNTTHGREAFLTVKGLSEDEPLQEWSFNLRNVEAHHGEDANGDEGNVITHVDVKEVSPVLEGAGINTRTLVAKAIKESAAATRTMLSNAGMARFGGDDIYVWVEDFDPEAKTVVFSISDDATAERLVKVTYEADGDEITLGADEAEVVRVTEYVPKSGARLNDEARSVVAGVARLINRTADVVAMRAEKGKALAPESIALVHELDVQLDRLKELVARPTADHPPVLTPDAVMFQSASMLLEE